MAPPNENCNGSGNYHANGTPPRPLHSRHREDLRRSTLSDETIAACGFYTVDGPDVPNLLNWKPATRSQVGACLVIPFWDADGNRLGYVRLKPDRPRKGKNGKPVKYESPKGSTNLPYFPPGIFPALKDPSCLLLVTEGEKKAAAATQAGFPCVGLVGVYGWQQPRPRGQDGKTHGPRELIEGLAKIPWRGRRVLIVFDSDAAEKREVLWGEWHFARALRVAGADVKVVRLPPGPTRDDGKPAKQGLDDFLAAHGPEALRRLLDEARDPLMPTWTPQASDLPTIQANRRQLQDVTGDALRAVLDRNDPPTVFQRGQLLTRVRVRPDDDSVSLEPLTESALRGVLARRARWVNVKKSQSGDVYFEDVFPPLDVAKDLAGLPAWEGVPLLESVSECPVYSSSGDLITTAGYHPAARLWYQPARGLEIPAVPRKPTRDDIDRAKALLLVELYGDFPFVGDASRAHALAALILPFVRRLIDGPTPLHLFDAPTEGTGEGLIVSCVTVVGTGREAEPMTEAGSDEEWRKRITATLADGPVFILLDNLNRILNTGALASVLTSRTWKDRLLGFSRTASLPNMAEWLATANNARLSRELRRRTVPSRVDAQMSEPWERKEFRHPKLIRWAGQNRGQLIWAALVLCQAWMAAGKPAGKETLGSFEAWAEVMGGILEAAGVPGFLGNLKEFHATAVDWVSEWQEFVSQWWKAHQGAPVGVQELFALATANTLLDSVLGDKGERSQRTRLGQALARVADRVFGEHRIERDTKKDHSDRQQFRLVQVGPQGAPAATAKPGQPNEGDEQCEWTG
jgi:putative DNA primase/helicase